MAGKGERFSKAEFSDPKPMIEFKNQPLYLWALKSVMKELLKICKSELVRINFVFCREDSFHKNLLGQNAIQKFRIEPIFLEKRTGGPLESAHLALKKNGAVEGPVIFCDCDLAFQSDQWSRCLSELAHGSVDGLILYFKAKSSRYSFVQIDRVGLAIKVSEKNAISDFAMVGVYAFKNAETFIKGVENLKSEKSEIYISDLIQNLIEKGKKFKCLPVDESLSMGTPEELVELIEKCRRGELNCWKNF